MGSRSRIHHPTAAALERFRQLRAEKHPIEACARAMGMSASTARRWMTEYGLPGRVGRRPRPKALTAPEAVLARLDAEAVAAMDARNAAMARIRETLWTATPDERTAALALLPASAVTFGPVAVTVAQSHLRAPRPVRTVDGKTANRDAVLAAIAAHLATQGDTTG